MYIEMNEEQASAVIAAMADHIQQLALDNDYLRGALIKRMRCEKPAADPAEDKQFDRDALEEWLREVEGDE